MSFVLPKKPSDVTWTDDQWKAIYQKGEDILVGAAAGSGKTAVLIERIIEKILDSDHPIEVDRILVVTFTDAAAREMRNRLSEAIERALIKNPTSKHLRRQLGLLGSGNISTIHSFCLKVIGEYHYKLDIDPSFRIGDTTELALIKDEVLEQLLEGEYAKKENEDFFALVNAYTSDRDDDFLKNMIDKMYQFAVTNPNPEQFLQLVLNGYVVTAESTLTDYLPTQYAIDEVSRRAVQAVQALQSALRICDEPGGPEVYKEKFEELKQGFLNLQKATQNRNWSEIAYAYEQIEFGRLPAASKKKFNEDLIEAAKQFYSIAKDKVYKNVLTVFFMRTEANHLEDIRKLQPFVAEMVRLVRLFMEQYQAEKRKQCLVDFHDIEHFCLQILQQWNPETKSFERTDVAKKYADFFEEILVDEYQDTNMVQEAIVKGVSKTNEGSGNMFMVGDVKQSIYRFRLAEPQLFLNKYEQFSYDGNQYGRKIDLSRNFRSRHEVLGVTNYLFQRLMDTDLGDVQYDNNAALHVGATYPSNEQMSAELWVIDESIGEESAYIAEESETDSETVDMEEGTEESFEDLTRYRLEARLIVDRIQNLREENCMVYDAKKKTSRPFQYRDVVILVRAMTGVPEMMEEFRKAGIGVYGEISKGYFDAVEVQVALSLLKIIDNPLQDIPFVAVLRSPLVHVSEEVLTKIRLSNQRGYFYEACQIFVNNPSENVSLQVVEELRVFLERLEHFRTEARRMSLPELIYYLYEQTGYFDFVGGLTGGKQRQANLQALYDRAKNFESTSLQGLFRFLRFIERMKKRGDDMGEARALGEQEDVVRIMSIHKSKGLEFPIVFLCNLSKQFNLRDLTSPYLLSQEAGLGLMYRDGVERIMYDTFLQIAMKQNLRMNQLSEELRVLYVALTRAKEKLIMIGSVRDLEKAQKKWMIADTWMDKVGVLPVYMRSDARNYLDWIMLALYGNFPFANGFRWQHGEIDLTLYLTKAQNLQNEEQNLEEASTDILQRIKNRESLNLPAISAEVQERFSYIYPFEGLTKIPSHTSATEMKRKQLEQKEEVYEQITGIKRPTFTIQEEDFAPPKFIQQQALNAAQIGTATHFVMQTLDFSRPLDEADIRLQMEEMLQKEMLTKQQVKAIDTASIAKFFAGDLGQTLRVSKVVYRELPFIFGIPIEEVYPNLSHQNEKLYVKGIIDCLFQTKEGWVILDFKTDHLAGKTFAQMEQKFRKRYEKQIEIYTRATEELIHQPVWKKYLYFLDANQMMEM